MKAFTIIHTLGTLDYLFSFSVGYKVTREVISGRSSRLVRCMHLFMDAPLYQNNAPFFLLCTRPITLDETEDSELPLCVQHVPEVSLRNCAFKQEPSLLILQTAAAMLESSPIAFFFRNKPKSDLVKPTKDLITRLRQPPKLQKVSDCDVGESMTADMNS